MTHTANPKLWLAAAGAMVFVAIAVRDPAPSALTAALFASAWWLRRRMNHRGTERRRHVRHVRRHATAVALLVAGAWTLLVLGRTAVDLGSLATRVSDNSLLPSAPTDDEWPGALLIEQVAATAALAVAVGGVAGSLVQRRTRRHKRTAAETGVPAAVATLTASADLPPAAQAPVPRPASSGAERPSRA